VNPSEAHHLYHSPKGEGDGEDVGEGEDVKEGKGDTKIRNGQKGSSFFTGYYPRKTSSLAIEVSYSVDLYFTMVFLP